MDFLWEISHSDSRFTCISSHKASSPCPIVTLAHSELSIDIDASKLKGWWELPTLETGLNYTDWMKKNVCALYSYFFF